MNNLIKIQLESTNFIMKNRFQSRVQRVLVYKIDQTSDFIMQTKSDLKYHIRNGN